MRERWESGEEFEGGAREKLKGVERVKESIKSCLMEGRRKENEALNMSALSMGGKNG